MSPALYYSRGLKIHEFLASLLSRTLHLPVYCSLRIHQSILFTPLVTPEILHACRLESCDRGTHRCDGRGAEIASSHLFTLKNRILYQPPIDVSRGLELNPMRKSFHCIRTYLKSGRLLHHRGSRGISQTRRSPFPPFRCSRRYELFLLARQDLMETGSRHLAFL